jgi:hypothetical protein
MKIQATQFGMAFGTVYAVVFFLYGALAAMSGWGAEFADLIGSFYLGFGPSLAGAVIGAVWGFCIGFVFFGLAAWIYNRLVDRSARN